VWIGIHASCHGIFRLDRQPPVLKHPDSYESAVREVFQKRRAVAADDLTETGGAEEITLTVQQIASHSHPLLDTSAFATVATPQNNVPASASVVNVDAYGTDQPPTPVSPATISTTGGSQPHSKQGLVS